MSRSLVRLSAGLVMAAALAGCAQYDRETVAVGIGTAAYVPVDARPYAYLYRPYVMMASLAYTNPQFLQSECPSADLLRDPRLVDAQNTAEDNLAAAALVDELRKGRRGFARQKDRWTCLFGQVGAVGCPTRGRVECVPGLEYHVWRRNDCGEAVIAFRGTDGGDLGDWLSNLRWFVGGRVFDQYDQVQKAIRGDIDNIMRQGCRPRRIIAVGHSLGGGLAQHVGYADARIDYVYAFDPSPVTAFFSVRAAERTKSIKDLGIDRIYMSGEILSLPRYIVSGVFASSPCRPRVRIVRFHTLTSPSLTERHRIAELNKGIVDLSSNGGKPPALPEGFTRASNCTFVDPTDQGV